jgi:hypothetical protein
MNAQTEQSSESVLATQAIYEPRVIQSQLLNDLRDMLTVAGDSLRFDAV